MKFFATSFCNIHDFWGNNSESECKFRGEDFKEKCSICHSLKRVYNKKVDEAGWEEIIKRRLDKGVNLNLGEKKKLIRYLLKQ